MKNYEESFSHLKSVRRPIVTIIRFQTICYLLAILSDTDCWLFELTIIIANERFTTTHDALRLDGQLFLCLVKTHNVMLSIKCAQKKK